MIGEIIEYLDANVTDITSDPTGVSGNIFQDRLPAEPDIAVMVEPTGGFPRDMRNTQYFEPTVRVLTRSDADPRNGYDLAVDVIDVLGALGSMEFVDTGAEWRVIKCQAVQAFPINIGQDDNGRNRYSCNFELEVQRKE